MTLVNVASGVQHPQPRLQSLPHINEAVSLRGRRTGVGLPISLRGCPLQGPSLESRAGWASNEQGHLELCGFSVTCHHRHSDISVAEPACIPASVLMVSTSAYWGSHSLLRALLPGSECCNVCLSVGLTHTHAPEPQGGPAHRSPEQSGVRKLRNDGDDSYAAVSTFSHTMRVTLGREEEAVLPPRDIKV